MQTSDKELSPFLEKLIQFDFEKFYTPRNRILCHVVMWLFFTSLLFSTYFLEIKLELVPSILITLRRIVNDMAVFYFYFYIAVPIIFKSKAWGLFLLLVFAVLSIYIWMIVNVFQFKVINYFEYDIREGKFQGIVNNVAKRGYKVLFSFNYFFSNLMPIINYISPMFFLKILLDITRLFKKLKYFQKQTAELELENLNAEKNFLKAQLNPHFLFNTLNNLYGLVIKNNPMAPKVIDDISDMMAYTIHESNTEKVTVEKELNFMKNYFNLEKIRHSTDKDITMEVSLDDDIEHLEIAPLLCFTFMENGFKYGLKSKNSFLRISINVKNKIFYFEIENDKEIGLKITTTLGGIGITNIEKRLNLLYPNQHELTIEDRESQFFVSLSINLS